MISTNGNDNMFTETGNTYIPKTMTNNIEIPTAKESIDK